MPRTAELRIIPVRCAAEIKPGDSIPGTLLEALKSCRQKLCAGDILVIKHKIISKSESRIVDLNTIRPDSPTRAWARHYRLDPRVTALAVSESIRMVRRRGKVMITETRHGFICANSGVDVSNVDGGRHALLLPEDPDASAARLHREIKKRLGISVPVIITDSFGRPWREGLAEVAIGLAGMKALEDYRGRRDPHGYELHATIDAVADQLACAAGLVCGKLTRTPFCIIRGFAYSAGRGRARDLIRPAANDLFR